MEQIGTGDYTVDIIVQGFPGQSVCHGNLGWSTISLIRGHQWVALVDAGPIGMRRTLIQRLSKRGVTPIEVTDVLLTHLHHDHAINWTLFSKSRIVVGRLELDWAVKQPWGETPVPELYVRELQAWPMMSAVTDGQEVLPGITAHLSPGHTPGSLIYILKGTQRDVIFTGDAAKNRAELVSGAGDMTYDAAVSAESIKRIWDLWRHRPGTVVIPGHDLAMVQENGNARYIDERDAGIRTWFGDNMEKMETFQLNVAPVN
jgi:N-acyl homoserine lactone hydrolase